MRFIHAADIHLDSPLTGLSAYPDAPVDVLRTATRDAFEKLVDLAITEAVDFMVIAGDLYDGSWKDFNTGLYFVRQMGRLKHVGIPVYVLYGNHDADSEMTKKLSLPDNVHVFPSGRAATFEIPELRVALHGRSFKDAATTEDLVVSYPPPQSGWFNIGVLHTALEGYAAHARYAPCSIDELHAKGYQYWALGHVHDYQQWDGPSTIAFPGNLQGRNVRETGSKGALLVTADGLEVQSVERVVVDVLRWLRLRVDVSSAATLTDVARMVGQRLEDLLDDGDASLPLAVRTTVTGATAAHGELFGFEPQLRAEVLAQAVALAADRFWIEKVEVDTVPLESQEQLANRSDAIADLLKILVDAPRDEALLESLRDDFAELFAKMPVDISQSLPQLRAIRNGELGELLKATIPSLLARISAAE